MADDPDMRPLIKEFIENLDDYAVQLDQAVRTENVAFARQLCDQLKGAGGGYGLDPITLSAQMALSILQDEQPNLKAMKRSIDDLIMVIRSVKM